MSLKRGSVMPGIGDQSEQQTGDEQIQGGFGFRFLVLLKTKAELGSFRQSYLGSTLVGRFTRRSSR
jgi:hypothetical protein